METKQFAVIGLGRFGFALCEELYRQGEEIMVIDVDEERVKKASDMAVQAIVADASNGDVLKELDFSSFDIVFIAIGGDIYASVLATLILKERGVKKIWVKADDRHHERILRKIGADQVILPEKEIGTQTARKMIHDRHYRWIPLGGKSILADVKLSESNFEAVHEKLKETPEMKVLGVRRGNQILDRTEYNGELLKGDTLIVTGAPFDVDSLMS